MSDKVLILHVRSWKSKDAGVLATIDGMTVEYHHNRQEWWCKVPRVGDCILTWDECQRQHIEPVKALIHPRVFGWPE